MGERTARDDEKIRVSDKISDQSILGTLLWKKIKRLSVPNCPECTAREKKKIQAKYEADTPEEERDRARIIQII